MPIYLFGPPAPHEASVPVPFSGPSTKGIVEAADNEIDLECGIQYKAYWPWPEQKYWQLYLQKARSFHHETVARRIILNKCKDKAVLGDLDERVIKHEQMVRTFLMGISERQRDRTVVVVDKVNMRLRVVAKVQQGTTTV